MKYRKIVSRGRLKPVMSPLLNHQELSRLLERCKNQDSRAWSDLVEQFQALVYSIARRHGLNSDDAEDVFVTTFQHLFRSIDRLESAAALPRWLAVTASRESLRIGRIANRLPDFESAGISLDSIVAREESQAEHLAIEADQALRVRDALSRMDSRCRDLLKMLYFQDDAGYSEISNKLTMPVGAIGPTRSRCLEKLRSTLSKEGFFDF